MAYSVSNKCAKNLCKWTFLVQLIIKNVVTCFLEHSVYTGCSKLKDPTTKTAIFLKRCNF